MNVLLQSLVILLVLSMATYPMPVRLDLGFGSLPYYVPIGLLLATLAVIRSLRERRVIRYPPPLQVATWGLLTCLGISSWVSSWWPIPVDIPQSLRIFSLGSEKAVYLGIRYVPFILIVPVVVEFIDNHAGLKRAIVALVVVSILLNLYGYFGFFTGSTGDPIQHALGYWGLWYGRSTRNSDALYMSVGVILVGAYLISHRQTRAKLGQRVMNAVLILAFMAMGIAVVISYSRGAWVSVLAGLAYLLLTVRGMPRLRSIALRRLGMLLILATASCAVFIKLVYATPELLLARWQSLWILSIPGVSNWIRIELLMASVPLVLSHPLGLGVGTFWAENAYLGVVIELGLLALILFLVLVIFPLRVLVGYVPDALAREDGWVYWAVAAVGITISVHNLFNVEITSMYYWVVHSLVVSAAMVVHHEHDKGRV